MGRNPSQFKGDDRPVEQVSWDDCLEFCRKLGELFQKPIRLPTEAEWEYACRAGSRSEYCNGDGAESLKRVGWFAGNSEKQTQIVGRLGANAWGLYDVHGNVNEWCHDGYETLRPVDQTDPIEQPNGKYRVLRGGSWGMRPDGCLAASRSVRVPGARVCNDGLRVCFFQES